MPSDLAAFRTLIRSFLGDSAGTRYDNTAVDTALRLALHEYSWQYPQRDTYSLTLLTADRDQVITPAGYLFPIELHFPNTSTPYFLFSTYRNEDDLHLILSGEDAPVIGDVLTLNHAQLQTIEDLDSATVTSLPADHETHLAMGAAAFAAYNRSAILSENYSAREDVKTLLKDWGYQVLRDFRRWLKSGLSFSVPTIPSASGWQLDAHDSNYNRTVY